MKFINKVVIAVGMDEDMVERLRPVESMEFLQNCEVHFVTVFNTLNYGFVMGDIPLVYPVEADRKAIELTINEMLKNTSKQILPVGFAGRVVHECLFDQNPKSLFSTYVEDVKADLVIIAAREKKGFFESSFTQYVGKHTKANLLVLKPSR